MLTVPHFLSPLFLASLSFVQLDYSDLSPSFVQTIPSSRRNSECGHPSTASNATSLPTFFRK